MTTLALFSQNPVVPMVTIDDANCAPDLAAALMEGGIVVGAGTVVVSVSGSWIVPGDAVAERDWDRIMRLTRTLRQKLDAR